MPVAPQRLFWKPKINRADAIVRNMICAVIPIEEAGQATYDLISGWKIPVATGNTIEWNKGIIRTGNGVGSKMLFGRHKIKPFFDPGPCTCIIGCSNDGPNTTSNTSPFSLNGPNSRGFAEFLTNASGNAFNYMFAGGKYAVITPTAIPSGFMWLAVRGKGDSSNIDFFINGVKNSYAMTATSPAGPLPLNSIVIGCTGYVTSQIWNGRLWFAYVWNRLLSDGEIFQVALDPWSILEKPYEKRSIASPITVTFKPWIYDIDYYS